MILDRELLLTYLTSLFTNSFNCFILFIIEKLNNLHNKSELKKKVLVYAFKLKVIPFFSEY